MINKNLTKKNKKLKTKLGKPQVYETDHEIEMQNEDPNIKMEIFEMENENELIYLEEIINKDNEIAEEELEEDEDETEYTDEVICETCSNYLNRTNGEIGINEILGSTVTEDEDNDNKESTEDEDETYIKV